MDQSEFQNQMRLLLQDTDSTRYSSDLLDSSLRQALNHFSLAVPRVNKAELMVIIDSTEVTLNSLSTLTQVLALWYPWCDGDLPTPPLQDWYLYWQSGVPVLRLNERIFEEGTTLKLFYAANHTITGLDDAESTSVPEVMQEMLALGAAGKAAQLRAAHLVESYGSPASDRNQLLQLGQLWWEGFKARLTEFKRLSPAPTGPFDEFGWAVDG